MADVIAFPHLDRLTKVFKAVLDDEERSNQVAQHIATIYGYETLVEVSVHVVELWLEATAREERERAAYWGDKPRDYGVDPPRVLATKVFGELIERTKAVL